MNAEAFFFLSGRVRSCLEPKTTYMKDAETGEQDHLLCVRVRRRDADHGEEGVEGLHNYLHVL